MHTRRNRLLILVPVLMLAMGISIAQPAADFRNVRWGLTPRQVREAETLKPSSVKSDKLVYARVPLTDRTVGLEYEFNGDSLLSASYYYYTTASISKDDVTAASRDISALLTEKYGPGKSATVGDSRQTRWLTPRTQITLALGNVDRGWSMEIIYLCRVCSGEPTGKAQPKSEWKPLRDIKDL